jgi:hypothetical protein
MAIITTGNYPKAYWPGIKQAWINYKANEAVWDKIFEKTASDKSYEEYLEMDTFGLIKVKPEGQAISYDSDSQGTTPRFRNVTYAGGFIVTKEAMDDCLIKEVTEQRTPRLARSAYETKEVNHANVLNNAFDTAVTMENGDGVNLCSTAHPSSKSNRLTIDADLCETSLESLLIQINKQTNHKGIRTNIKALSLIVPAALEYEAARITQSTLQYDTANNAINAIKTNGKLPQGVITYKYLTDDDAWFVKTDCELGLVSQQRMPLELSRDNEFDTENLKVKCMERYSLGWVNYNGLFGSQGA